MDEGLLSELKKQGIFVTSLQELYNWGRLNSIWPCNSAWLVVRSR